ncbi:hypothetical protein DL98DRAFT_2504 [Cadophora sp. DSE1049]|nr:hypothetical protein DL98DRAFT_2504 [Cadophora sp. DSE1049]
MSEYLLILFAAMPRSTCKCSVKHILGRQNSFLIAPKTISNPNVPNQIQQSNWHPELFTLNFSPVKQEQQNPVLPSCKGHSNPPLIGGRSWHRPPFFPARNFSRYPHTSSANPHHSIQSPRVEGSRQAFHFYLLRKLDA